jgi:hypothetical protein
MEKTLLILFLILFLGRIIWRYFLQQVNIRHLRNYGKVIPPVFQGMIDEATLSKMVDYTYDNSRLASKENLTDDILELAVLFILLPVLVGKLFGLQWHLIWQALIFFGVLSLIGGVAVGINKKQSRGIGLLQNVFQFMGLIIRVHRNQDAARHSQRTLQISPFGNIGRPDGDIIATLDANCHESFGDIPACLVKFAVSLPDSELRRNQSDVFRIACGRILD